MNKTNIKRARGKNEYQIEGNDCLINIFGVHHIYKGTVIVDAENTEKCKQHKWFIRMRNGKSMGAAGHVDGKRSLRMHHFLFGSPPDGMEYDHINRNPLDNRKSNLRLCTTEQNQWNRGLTKANTSGIKGVRKEVNNKWSSKIWHKRKMIVLGYFDNKIDAAIAYNEHAKKLHGDFAYLNQIGGA